jgi:predicted GH43/DUF377 family glycosyl hydrolase
VLSPETAGETDGVVANVVFPTGIDPRPDIGGRDYDVYYGMADARIGCVRVEIGASQAVLPAPKESAA